jgi:hypothetical protein
MIQSTGLPENLGKLVYLTTNVVKIIQNLDILMVFVVICIELKNKGLTTKGRKLGRITKVRINGQNGQVDLHSSA